jgi:hypothetical protein
MKTVYIIMGQEQCSFGVLSHYYSRFLTLLHHSFLHLRTRKETPAEGVQNASLEVAIAETLAGRSTRLRFFFNFRASKRRRRCNIHLFSQNARYEFTYCQHRCSYIFKHCL